MTSVVHRAPQTSPSERRRGGRSRVLYPGILVHGAASLTADCVVRDYTPTGARIRLTTPGDLETPIMLIVCPAGDAFEAKVAWRRGGEFGLQFEKRRDVRNPQTAAESVGRRLWIERLPR